MSEEKQEFRTETQRVWERDSLHTSYGDAQARLTKLRRDEDDQTSIEHAKIHLLSAGFAVKVWRGKTREVKIKVKS